ncbi:hypothetical protein EZV62_025654 [Acer yangbiense]|uniref:Uncharacterized protein n=1 Tax=Acer yangbiense TaxID=1000413 RepID=A0A5C7GZ15_9ROSI|nr:hypothetical protein EZV62_025654 [Acer yangbiense]
MNRKFGGAQPTGTPSLARSCVVVIVSLLAGASVVHNIYKPDLVKFLPPSFVLDAHQLFDKIPESGRTLPPMEQTDGDGQKQLPEKP